MELVQVHACVFLDWRKTLGTLEGTCPSRAASLHAFMRFKIRHAAGGSFPSMHCVVMGPPAKNQLLKRAIFALCTHSNTFHWPDKLIIRNYNICGGLIPANTHRHVNTCFLERRSGCLEMLHFRTLKIWRRLSRAPALSQRERFIFHSFLV